MNAIQTRQLRWFGLPDYQISEEVVVYDHTAKGVRVCVWAYATRCGYLTREEIEYRFTSRYKVFDETGQTICDQRGIEGTSIDKIIQGHKP